MGGALLRGWLAKGLNGRQVAVLQPSRSVADELTPHGVAVVASLAELSADFVPQFVVVAVRPNQLAEACAPLKDAKAVQGAGVISIVAGVSVVRLQELFPQASAIVRAMPNLPVEVQRGMTSLFAAPDTKVEAKKRSGRTVCLLGQNPVARQRRTNFIDNSFGRKWSCLCVFFTRPGIGRSRTKHSACQQQTLRS